MSLLPNAPKPEPTALDAEFWRHCRERRLMFQGCAACGALRHPPMPFCASCRSTAVEWREAPPSARVFSYTIVHHPADASVRDATPYIVGVVEFEGFGPVRLITNILARPEDMRIGMPVSLVWEGSGDTLLPRFVTQAVPLDDRQQS